MTYRFLPEKIHKCLMSNARFDPKRCRDMFPVVKLFTPDDTGVWLLAKVLKNNPNTAYGLIDTGQGNPHIGYIDLGLLAAARGKMGMPIERDINFVPQYPLWVYEVASTFDGIYTEDEVILSGIFRLQTIQPKLIYPKPSMN